MGKLNEESLEVFRSHLYSLQRFQACGVIGLVERVDDFSDLRLEFEELLEFGVVDDFGFEFGAVKGRECAKAAVCCDVICAEDLWGWERKETG